jgi:Tfp pilus assembly pilus retraction ATPase PilT
MAKIDAFLKKAYEIRASDFHLATGNPPMFHRYGRLRRIKYQELTSSLFLEMPTGKIKTQ